MIIGFTGLAGCGKSTAARHLEQEYNWTRMRMADPLKNMLRSLYSDMGLDASEQHRRIEGDLKELPDKLTHGKSPRQLMQTLGTEWGRGEVSENFWTTILGLRIMRAKGHVVVEDVRFDNEAKVILAAGGRVIKIVRHGHTGSAADHQSEGGVNDRYISSRFCVPEGKLEGMLKLVDQLATRQGPQVPSSSGPSP